MKNKHGHASNHTEVPRKTLVDALSDLSKYYSTEDAAEKNENQPEPGPHGPPLQRYEGHSIHTWGAMSSLLRSQFAHRVAWTRLARSLGFHAWGGNLEASSGGLIT